MTLAPDVAEGNVAPQRRRGQWAGYVTNLPSAEEQFVAAFGEFRQIIRQTQAAQGLRDLAVGADAGDDFLANVATLRVTDGPIFNPGFRREVRLVHVTAKTRHAGFDPDHLQRPPAARL